MYCPNCGSTNKAGTKFCARCGTNIAAITDALAGKSVGQGPIDERMMKLIKDYHKGRRDAITGAVLIPAGVLIMGIMAAAGLKPIAAFFIICWMFFWGVSALADGLGKWIGSSGEMKSLEHLAQAAAPPQISQGQAPVTGYSTGPIEYPASVTEQTTRKLEQHPISSSSEGQSNTGD